MPDPLDLILRNLKRASASAAVGAHDEENATKLKRQEFGTPTIPARPTLTAATDRAEGTVFRAVERQVAWLLDGKTRTGVAIVQDVGADLAELVRDEIGDNVGDPLKPATIAARRRRGNDSTRTLVDSGKMQGAVTVVVKDGEGGWPDEE